MIHLYMSRASRASVRRPTRPEGFVRLDEIGPQMDRQLATSDTDMVAAHAEFHGGQDGTLDWFSTDCVMHEVLMGRMFFHCGYRPELVAFFLRPRARTSTTICITFRLPLPPSYAGSRRKLLTYIALIRIH